MTSEQARRDNPSTTEKDRDSYMSFLDNNQNKPHTGTISQVRTHQAEIINEDEFTDESLSGDEQGGKSREGIRTVQDKAKEMGTTALQKAVETKDVVAIKGQSAARYFLAAAVAAKMAAVENGKGAAGYVGKVAVEVKDQAVVAGWGTVQYTLEKMAEASNAAAGYSAEKAEAATKAGDETNDDHSDSPNVERSEDGSDNMKPTYERTNSAIMTPEGPPYPRSA